MAMDYAEKFDRLMRILVLIQGSPGTVTASMLVRELGVTQRTVMRYLSNLRDAGVPVDYDEQSGGYRIRNGFFMPPMELKFDEALGLLALGAAVRRVEQIPMTRSAAQALEKVFNRLPTRLREELGELDNRLEVKLAPAGPFHGHEDVYDTVKEAITKQRVLQCSYEGLRSQEQPELSAELFLFEPYRLVFNQRAWYAVGFHRGRDALRQLKLNRFTAIHLTDERFKIPKDFSLQEFYGNAWRMMKGEKAHRVRLVFDASFAETIADTSWHPTQEIVYRDDGGIDFSCTVDGLDEIVWWILSMGPHCQVLEPAELVEKVQTLAGQTAALYDSN